MKFAFPVGKIGHIMVADGCFSHSIASELIEECKASFDVLFRPGPTLGGVNSMVKNSMDFGFNIQNVMANGLNPTVFSKAEKEIHDGLHGALAHYRDEYRGLWYWPDIADSGFRLQYYPKNTGFYREHSDSEPWTNTDRIIDGLPSSSQRVRVLAAVIYLNDVADGGETFFNYHGVDVVPKTGRICLFPANWTHLHGGRTPRSNPKWMISTFLTCPAPFVSEVTPEGLTGSKIDTVDSE